LKINIRKSKEKYQINDLWIDLNWNCNKFQFKIKFQFKNILRIKGWLLKLFHLGYIH